MFFHDLLTGAVTRQKLAEVIMNSDVNEDRTSTTAQSLIRRSHYQKIS